MQIVHGRAGNMQCIDYTDLLGSLGHLTAQGIQPIGFTRSGSVLDDDDFPTTHSHNTQGHI
jgi:hypothetical protein